jgi:hypothetical protein
MKLARIVFLVAGVWGIVVLTPFFWLVDITGRHYPSPVEYPQFFLGFFAITAAWQIAFLLIGSNPARFRPLMPAAMVEKFSYVAILLLLYNRGRIGVADAQAAVPDLLLGLLFAAAFVATSSRRLPPQR